MLVATSPWSTLSFESRDGGDESWVASKLEGRLFTICSVLAHLDSPQETAAAFEIFPFEVIIGFLMAPPPSHMAGWGGSWSWSQKCGSLRGARSAPPLKW
eukprot:10881157-Heterocapsa_arctica.AAC.1